MKIRVQGNLFGAAEISGEVTKDEQLDLFPVELVPDVARERKLAKQHKSEGGKEIEFKTQAE